MEGFILVSKPNGVSSFQVVKKVRQLTGVKRVGHCGTLDPFATGLLIIAIGRQFTKHIDHFQALPKGYAGKMILGVGTDTDDCYGRVTERAPITLTELELKTTLDDVSQSFLGEIDQIPPAFSAKKIDGTRAYKLARKGDTPQLEAKKVTIHMLDIHNVRIHTLPSATFSVDCSKGTYIRSLVRDMCAKIGTVGYLKDLIRTSIGPFQNDHAIAYEHLSSDTILNDRFFSITGMGS